MTGALVALAIMAQLRMAPAPPIVQVYTHNDTVLALRGAPAVEQCMAYLEAGRSGAYAPMAIGDHGLAHGQFQLRQDGLLPDFYAQGYRDPYSPYQADQYTRGALARGLGGHWPSYTQCRAGARYRVYGLDDTAWGEEEPTDDG